MISTDLLAMLRASNDIASAASRGGYAIGQREAAAKIAALEAEIAALQAETAELDAEIARLRAQLGEAA